MSKGRGSPKRSHNRRKGTQSLPGPAGSRSKARAPRRQADMTPIGSRTSFKIDIHSSYENSDSESRTGRRRKRSKSWLRLLPILLTAIAAFLGAIVKIVSEFHKL